MDGFAGGKLRGLPPMQRLLEQPEALRLAGLFSRAAVTEALRRVLTEARAALLAPDGPPEPPNAAALLRRAADALGAPGLRRVINATGIVIHTNLGRAPMADSVCDAVAAVAVGTATWNTTSRRAPAAAARRRSSRCCARSRGRRRPWP